MFTKKKYNLLYWSTRYKKKNASAIENMQIPVERLCMLRSCFLMKNNVLFSSLIRSCLVNMLFSEIDTSTDWKVFLVIQLLPSIVRFWKKNPGKIELIINVQIEIYFIKSYNFFLFINKKTMNVCITHISVK